MKCFNSWFLAFSTFMLIWMNSVNGSAITLGSSSFTLNDYYWSYSGEKDIDETIASINLLFGFGEIGMQNAPGITDWSWYAPAVKLFDIVGLGTNSIGETYYADISSDEYDYAIDLLTNGKEEYGSYVLWHNDGECCTPWDFHDIYSGNGVDFEGYSINNISLRIDGFNLYYAGFDADGIWGLNYGWDVTVSIDGHATPVPEPATILMLIFGIIIMTSLGMKYKSGIVELGSCAAG